MERERERRRERERERETERVAETESESDAVLITMSESLINHDLAVMLFLSVPPPSVTHRWVQSFGSLVVSCCITTF